MNCGLACCNSNTCMSFVGFNSWRMRLRGCRTTPHCAGNTPLLECFLEQHYWISVRKKIPVYILILFVFVGLFSRLWNLYMCFLCCRDEKIAIMREKHSALMRPVVFALDHVCSITAAPAETPHETWFQQTYGSDIISALERLKNPTNPANPSSSWLPFKQVRSWCIYTVFSGL